MDVWKSVGKQYLFGIANNNFQQVSTKPNRLPLDVGDSVIIIRESTNWYYGYNKKNRTLKGIFPKSYVQIIADVAIVKHEYVIKRSEIVDEITTVLKEWHEHFKRFFLFNDNIELKKLREKMLELVRLRSQMLSGNLPVDEMKDVKLKATSEIDTGNQMLGLDMVVRDDNGNKLDINQTSTTQLYLQHREAVKRIKMATQSDFNKNRSSKTMNKFSHNLLISVHNFVCKVNEDTELLFTLYDGEEMKAITENYLVKWNRQGSAPYFNNIRMLFTDLSSMDLHRNKIYLVAYVVRVGAMDGREQESRRISVANAVLAKRTSSQSQNSSSLNLNDLMRRPFGVAALDLTPVIKKAEDFKSDTQLSMPFVPCEKETMETTLKKLIMNKELGKDGSNIWISVELLHGDLKQLKEEYPHLIQNNVTFARKMGFPEVIFPGDVRNDLYVTLVSGEFSKSTGKTSDKNIEVTISVCNDQGETVSDVITQGGGAAMVSEYHSVIYYHEDRPKWNETFKVNVEIDDFIRCHLKFTFKHRSSNDTKDKNEKPFAMAFVKLQQDNGTTLSQDKHSLVVYKIDYKKYEKETQFNYYTLPSQSFELLATPKPSAPGFSLLHKDSFVIETNLCSTKLTQDVDLLGLLKWSANPERLEDSLRQLLRVQPEEIVKFLQDILDALFKILTDNVDALKYNDLVFQCLLLLIEIVSDKKYQHFQSVLDLYINESFSSTLAYNKLIDVLERHFLDAFNNVDGTDPATIFESDKPSERKLYKTIRNLQYIMKFIIKSWMLFADMSDDRARLAFETRLEDLMGYFVHLISLPHHLLRSQGAILKYLHVIASDLMQVYDPLKLSNFVVEIIQKIPQGRLNQSKMTCIKDLVDSKLFRLPLCRGILLPVFCLQIKDKLESKEEGDIISDIWQQEKNLTKAAKILGESKSQLHARESTGKTKVSECVTILNNILEILFAKDIVGPVENDIRDIMLILLRTVIQSSIAMDRDNPLVGNLVAIMLAIFRNMTETHYKMYVNHFNTRYDLQDFLTEILLVFKELVSKPVFLPDWMDMIMHQNTVILESLRHFAKIIKDHFFDQFEQQVWSNFFHCSIAFLIQPALQLEIFTGNKKSIILTRYCDIRRDTANEIRDMWFQLGDHKIQFVPSMVGPLLEMSMIPETELRRSTIPIFFDMMHCEYVSSKYHAESFGDTKRNTSHMKASFRDFEKEFIEKLDILVEAGRGDHEYKDLFYEIMMELSLNHIALKNEGTIFVNMATKLMERLLEYRFLINDESKENRMSCTVSLLQFYSEVNRKEMYIRYVNKLCDLHMEFDNYTEAAFTLKLHSNLLRWDDTQLSPLLRSCRHPHCQTHRHLKEELYKEIVRYFDEGKMWECAVEICKELAHQYEYEIYDYMNLSRLHKQMATFYEKILNIERHEAEYFRVTFFGLGFPELLRNRTFVYRGKEYEQLSSFCARILNQHPRAELMQKLEAPGPEITMSNGQFIQINKVDPIVSDRNNHYQNMVGIKNISQSILRYYKNNSISEFRFSRPFRDSSKNWMATSEPDNIGNLWLERTILRTEFPLPGILKWFQVEHSETFKIPPIECAIESMENVIKTLRDLLIKHQNSPSIQVSQLTMIIQGFVDAAVNGGTAKYEDAFLTEDYVLMNPDDVGFVEKLKNLLADSIPILDVAIGVHRSKVGASLLPLHERLEECFIKMQQHVEAKYGKRTTDLKFERDATVILRKGILSTPHMSSDNNRLSETSMGSSDSGIASRPPGRQLTTAFTKVMNFTSPTSFTRQTIGPSQMNRKSKDKITPSKTRRKSIRGSDRDSLSLPNSQFYTSAVSSITSLLSPIAPSPVDNEQTSIVSAASSNGSQPSTAPVLTTSSQPVFELTEELTPKRPLRSEAEKEKRLSRTQSMVANNSGIVAVKMDDASVSGDSSNSRNSIITTDSQTSEEDAIPPPLPAKSHRDSDYGNLPEDSPSCSRPPRDRYQMVVSNKSVPIEPISEIIFHEKNASSHYEVLEIRNHEVINTNEKLMKKSPPTPPPKPARGCSKDAPKSPE